MKANYDKIEFSLRKALVRVGGYATKDGTFVRGFQRKQLKSLANAASQVKLNPELVDQFVSGGQLPTRSQGAKEIGRAALSFVRNPARQIKQGFERERALLDAVSASAGREVTKGEIIKKGMEKGVTQLKEEAKKAIENPAEFVQSETFQELSVNVGGFVGSKAGAVAGPVGALAGDYVGARVVRRGFEDTKAFVASYQEQMQLPGFDQKGRLEQFRSIVGEARGKAKQVRAERGRNDLAGDSVGWLAGNTWANLSPIKVPLVGATAGLPAANYAQAVEKRMRERGEDVQTATAGILADLVNTGNAREQQLRDNVKDKWQRLLYMEN